MVLMKMLLTVTDIGATLIEISIEMVDDVYSVWQHSIVRTG